MTDSMIFIMVGFSLIFVGFLGYVIIKMVWGGFNS